MQSGADIQAQHDVARKSWVSPGKALGLQYSPFQFLILALVLCMRRSTTDYRVTYFQKLGLPPCKINKTIDRPTPQWVGFFFNLLCIQ
jgi:hypothetical protein